MDVVHIVFHITDATDMDDSRFGGITGGLSRGIVLRKDHGDGRYSNYFNVKTNGRFGELSYDKVYDEKAPSGYYGFTCKLNYGGADRHGVVIRLLPGESLELLVQDDLTDLFTFTANVSGHFTD